MLFEPREPVQCITARAAKCVCTFTDPSRLVTLNSITEIGRNHESKETVNRVCVSQQLQTTMLCFHVKCVPCCHGMARPLVAAGGDGLQIWSVAVGVFK
jgi:hypothetical protein